MPAIGPFLTELEAVLDTLPVDELKAAVLAHAARLPAGERSAFLGVFAPSPENARPGDELIASIDDFVGDLESGHFFQGWGWDPEIRDKRAWGDESWVDEMDNLFDATSAAFVAGDMTVAREAYGRLLRAFQLDEETGYFCGQETAVDMVRTDVPEAVARYLRAVYETTPPDERPEQLVDAIEDLPYVGAQVGLREMSEARRTPLPGLEGFLPAWIARLRGDHGPETEDSALLLAEAAALQGGSEGLAVLAREFGPGRPLFYLIWIDRLVADGDLTAVAAACREALAGIPPEDRVRAPVAERLADLAERTSDRAALADARREAWRAERSAERLLLLVSADATGELLVGEADRLSPDDDSALAWMLLILVGRAGEVATRLAAGSATVWSDHDEPGLVAVPFLLLASTGCSDAASRDTVLGRLLAGGRPTPLAELLLRRHADPTPEALRDRWLEAALSAVEARVADVLERQWRRNYPQVAELVVAGAEAMSLRDERDRADAFLITTRRTYSRYPAFRAALDEAARSSRVLRHS